MRARAARDRPRSSDAYLNIAEASGRDAARDVHRLARLTLPAVEHAPELPGGLRADRVQAAPELGRDPRVGGIAQHPRAAAVLDLPRNLGAELEVEAALVDRPRAVAVQEDAVVGVGDQIL